VEADDNCLARVHKLLDLDAGAAAPVGLEQITQELHDGVSADDGGGARKDVRVVPPRLGGQILGDGRVVPTADPPDKPWTISTFSCDIARAVSRAPVLTFATIG
jgi:hypothetical protein